MLHATVLAFDIHSIDSEERQQHEDHFQSFVVKAKHRKKQANISLSLQTNIACLRSPYINLYCYTASSYGHSWVLEDWNAIKLIDYSSTCSRNVWKSGTYCDDDKWTSKNRTYDWHLHRVFFSHKMCHLMEKEIDTWKIKKHFYRRFHFVREIEKVQWEYMRI